MATNLKRIFKHALVTRRAVIRAFPPHVGEAVEAAVRELERTHDVEIRVVAEAGLSLEALLRGETSRARAVELFSRLRVWDTEHNCGVLIYVQMADRAIEIVADRGIFAAVKQAEWEAICGRIAQTFREDRFEAGTMLGIREITSLIARHIPPRRAGQRNELPNTPEVL